MIEWSELWTQFTLGNAAILANVCLLPLYPGLIAFLAGNVQTARAGATEGGDTDEVVTNERPVWVTGLLGVFVLMGVITVMVILGLILHLLKSEFANIFNVLLPVIYITIIILGVLMFTGRNPFATMTTIQAPMLSNPFATAFLYGLLIGPMTLPCTGPVITSAIAFGATSPTSNIGTEIIYFTAFGLGFGWPLLVLPLFAAPLQKKFTRWLTKNHTLLTRASGVLLVGIGLFGFYTEFIEPSITSV
jgi:cytochrome c-type biogenesis protein